jgi:hypothetical protein
MFAVRLPNKFVIVPQKKEDVIRHLLLRLSLWELRDWLLRSPLLASLYAFPFHLPWGPLQELHYARGEASILFICSTLAK